MSDYPTTPEAMAAAQANYQRAQASDPMGYLRAKPEFGKDGFEINPKTKAASFSDRGLALRFGEWSTPAGLEDDEDLGALRTLHETAVTRYRDMAQTLADVAGEGELNHESRLKIAAHAIEPKLNRLAETAERELARVDATIAEDEAQIEASTRVAAALDLASFDAIRAWWRSPEGEKERGKLTFPTELPPAGRDPDPRKTVVAQLDNQTLQALGTVPRYVTGLSEKQYEAIRQELRFRMAPERVKRVDALRNGKARAIQALANLDRGANRFIDFKKARELKEREAKLAARYTEES